jgi:hypothetical protein
MSLIGLLLTGLFGTYLQVQELIYKQSQGSENSGQALHFMRTLSSDLNNIVFEKWNDRQPFLIEKSIIDGKRIDRLFFVSSSLYANPANYQNSAFNVSYQGKVDFEKGVVLYRMEDVFADSSLKIKGIPIPYVNNVEEFAVQASNNGRDWIDGWDRKMNNVLPRYLKVILKWNEAGKEREFEFELRPPLAWN